MQTPPTINLDEKNATLVCGGAWQLRNLSTLEPQILAMRPQAGPQWTLDASAIHQLDFAGALSLVQLMHRVDIPPATGVLGLSDENLKLVHLVIQHQQIESLPNFERSSALERIGQAAMAQLHGLNQILAFIGEMTLTLPTMVREWRRLRIPEIFSSIYHAGVTAVPIVALLSFLMGVVIAYQGGRPLLNYGMNIFVVDLVVLTMLREMAPLITAIIVAGRTGSAYTAEIGTMIVTQEVDALKAIGITSMEFLVLPKFWGLLVSLPLLTVLADLTGVVGGILISQIALGVDASDFIERIPNVMEPSSFWVGIIKAPIFAALITIISCYRGFQVKGSAQSVGRETTLSVVQSIFIVMVTDALFSILFNELDL